MRPDFKRSSHPIIAGIGIPVGACILFILFLNVVAVILRLVL